MRKISLLLLLLLIVAGEAGAQRRKGKTAEAQRAYLVKTLLRIADPVLEALSQGQLKQRMPVEARSGQTDRANYTYLEAFGRLLAGMAPWLELGPDKSAEGQKRAHYLELARTCIHMATDPASPDFMNFSRGAQPLVDAAFLAQALIRAPTQLWQPLPAKTKENLLAALKSTRKIKAYENNWLLFSAMVEAALLRFEGHCDTSVTGYAIRKHEQWFLGDGLYGDGPSFHWDYYNSYVIHPMLVEVLEILAAAGLESAARLDRARKRAVRYAAIQERLIAPDGSYPVIGRSITYRFGAFQLLALMSLRQQLPPQVLPQQVRAALYTCIRRQIEVPGTFNQAGWLQIGFAGHQPELGEGYISTGSLYLCAQAFLILGLPSENGFWQGPDLPWTSKLAWEGGKLPIDHAME